MRFNPSGTNSSESFGPYDAANNFKTLSLTEPGSGTTATSYPVNADEELSAAGSTTYGYNAQNRLTSAGSDSYAYSPNGEIQTSTVGGNAQTDTYSADGELQSSGSPNSPTLISSGSNQFSVGTSTSSKTLSVPLNATAAPGQVVLVEVSMTTSDSVTNAGNCSQAVYQSNSPAVLQVFVCVTQGGETSESLTFGSTLDSHAEVAQAFLFDNVNSASPIDASSAGTATNSATLTVPGLTTSHAGDALVVLQGAVNTLGSSGFNAPSGMSERAGDQSGSPEQTDAGEAQSNSAVPAGPTGSESSSITGTWSNSHSAGALIALNPASDTYAYDANGNRCAGYAGSTPSCTQTGVGITAYGYNAYNELCYTDTNPVAGDSCASHPAGSLDIYGYDGNGLRTGDNIGGTINNSVYDTQTRPGTPLIIDDGTNVYIYGPAAFGSGTAPVEQISLSGNTASYLVERAFGGHPAALRNGLSDFSGILQRFRNGER